MFRPKAGGSYYSVNHDAPPTNCDHRVRKEAAHLRRPGANCLRRHGVFVDPDCLRDGADIRRWIVFVQGPAISQLWSHGVFVGTGTGWLIRGSDTFQTSVTLAAQPMSQFELVLTFPDNYPFAAPNIKFTTPIFHPNVSPDDGSLCLRILQDQWSPTYRTDVLLQVVRTLLADPNFSASDEGKEIDEFDALVQAEGRTASGTGPRKLYHYTNEKSKKLIEKSGVLKASAMGACGPGVYTTCLHPTNVTQQQVVGNTSCKGCDWVIELDVRALKDEGFNVSHCNYGYDRSLKNNDHYLITKGRWGRGVDSQLYPASWPGGWGSSSWSARSGGAGGWGGASKWSASGSGGTAGANSGAQAPADSDDDEWHDDPQLMNTSMDIRLTSLNSVIAEFDNASTCTLNPRAAELFRTSPAAYKAGIEHSIQLFGQHLPGMVRQSVRSLLSGHGATWHVLDAVRDAVFDDVASDRSGFFEKAGVHWCWAKNIVAPWSAAIATSVRTISVMAEEEEQTRLSNIPARAFVFFGNKRAEEFGAAASSSSAASSVSRGGSSGRNTPPEMAKSREESDSSGLGSATLRSPQAQLSSRDDDNEVIDVSTSPINISLPRRSAASAAPSSTSSYGGGGTAGWAGTDVAASAPPVARGRPQKTIFGVDESKLEQVCAILSVSREDAELLLNFHDDNVQRSIHGGLEDPTLLPSLRLALDLEYDGLDDA